MILKPRYLAGPAAGREPLAAERRVDRSRRRFVQDVEEDEQVNLRLEAEYELMLTQR